VGRVLAFFLLSFLFQDWLICEFFQLVSFNKLSSVLLDLRWVNSIERMVGTRVIVWDGEQNYFWVC